MACGQSLSSISIDKVLCQHPLEPTAPLHRTIPLHLPSSTPPLREVVEGAADLYIFLVTFGVPVTMMSVGVSQHLPSPLQPALSSEHADVVDQGYGHVGQVVVA